jgi:hypothetical protein
MYCYGCELSFISVNSAKPGLLKVCGKIRFSILSSCCIECLQLSIQHKRIMIDGLLSTTTLDIPKP